MLHTRVFTYGKRIPAVLLCAAALLSLAACGAQETASPAGTGEEISGVPVETRAIEAGSISQDSTVSGVVTADDEAIVMVAVAAKCLETFADAGDMVEEGQVLCRLELDSTLSSYNAAKLSYQSAVQGYNDQAAVFNKQIASINDQIALLEQQIPQAEQQIPQAEEQISQAEQQIPQIEQQIAMYEQQAALSEKNVNDLKSLFAIGAASQAEIDNASLQLDQLRLQLNQARMSLDQAKLQIDQLKLQLEQIRLQPDQARLQVNQTQLQLQSAIATRNSTLSQLQTSIESARSNVQQLESALENIDENGNVTAPISGLLVSMNATKDNYVSTAMPVAVVNGTGKMDVTVSVSESLISKLHTGDTADVTVAALGRSFSAPIRSVERAANAQTRLYTVTLAVPDNVTGLLSGMFADVVFHTDNVDHAVIIPSEAILTSGSVQYVYVVENGTAKYVEVSTGMTGSGITEVTGGLSAGQQLVTVGQSYLSDGDAVRVVGEG